jgi:tetratricopeptide (TPR) repeat protein
MAATIAQLQNNAADAQKRYEQILARDPYAAVAANNLAWLYADHGGNLDVALQLARTAKRKLPDQPDVNDTLGWVYIKKNLPLLAVPVLQESVKKDPRNPVYQYHLALGYVGTGDHVRARAALEQALRLKPDFAYAQDARRLLAGLRG